MLWEEVRPTTKRYKRKKDRRSGVDRLMAAVQQSPMVNQRSQIARPSSSSKRPLKRKRRSPALDEEEEKRQAAEWQEALLRAHFDAIDREHLIEVEVGS